MDSAIDYVVSERRGFAEGMCFGDTGPYEFLSGRARFRIDPEADAQKVVTDITLAPRDEGLVHFESDFCILKPVNLGRGNQRLFFDYGNRGNKRCLQFFNDAPPSNSPATAVDSGNGFLMRRGYSIVWLGWQGDLLPGDGRMLLDVPVATEHGRTITGRTRTEFIAVEPGTKVFALSSLVSTRSYPAASLDTTTARLTRRRYTYSSREVISCDAWSFSRVERGGGVDNQGMENAIVSSDSHIYLQSGFEPGWIYELVYEARDPRVLGLGHVAVRDFVSFLKHGEATATGQPNPLNEGETRIEKAYAWGRSQTGRCIRDFIHLGFNGDAAGRRVFDGVMPHVAGAGKMWMNHRFANLVLLPGQEHENHFTPADRFPFSYAVSTDRFTGREDGILKRPDTDPKVIHTDTACEYWHRRASLVHTDTDGNDLTQPGNVRVYLWASSQHFAAPKVAAPAQGLALTYFNIVATSMLFRANLDNLNAWVSEDREPPPSCVPRRDDGTLVTYEDWRETFPTIPGLALPRSQSRLERLNFGPDIDAGIISKEPPEIIPGEEYPVQVPAVDADGNDVAGVRAPMVRAPLGTYTGWSLRRRDFGHGAMVGITGSYIPLPDSEDEREQTGDPRPSVLARYESSQAYAEAIRKAAEDLVEAGLMLQEDIDRCVVEAADWGRPRHDVRL